MINFTVTKDLDNDFVYVQQCLGDLRRKAPNALRNAVNQTARKYRKVVHSKVKEKYSPTDPDVIEDIRKVSNFMQMRNAKNTDLTAILSMHAKVITPFEFHVSSKKVTNEEKPRPKFYSAKVLSSSGMKPLNGNPKPFVVRFSNKHKAMVVRTPGKRMQEHPEKEAMRALYSPNKVNMANAVGAKELANEVVRDELTALIETQIDKILGGKR